MDANRAVSLALRRIRLPLVLSLVAAALSTVLAACPAGSAPADSAAAVPRALGCADGEREALSRHDPLPYLCVGALTGPIGVGYAAWRRPQPPASALAGQTPESSLEYSRCYAAKARRLNLHAASDGLAIAAMTALIAVFFVDSKTAP